MSAGELTPPLGPEDHVLGPADAAITLVEYGDYQCPHCAAAHRVVREVQRQLGASLRFAFRNFPLRQAHAHAEHAAEAAALVATLGGEEAFWKMHERLFEHPQALADADLVGHAVACGVAADAVEDGLAAETMATRVDRDFRSGVRSGVNGTPTFFVNGRRFDEDWRDAAGFAAALAAAGR